MKIGLKIQKLRTDSNMTQEELAESLFVSRALVSKWENDLRQPDYCTVQKISQIFNVDIECIISPAEMLLNELLPYIDDSLNYDSKQFAKKLNSFLRSINELDCKIFIRRYYYFEDTKAIAEAFNIKDGTVRSSLSRTRKKLQKYLSEDLDNEKRTII